EQELYVSSRDISDTKKRYEDEQYEIQSQSVQSDSHLTEPHKHQESDPNTETMTQVEHPGRSVEQLNTQVEHPGRSVEQLNTQVEHPKRLRLRRDKVRELKSQGYSQREMAKILNVSLGSVNTDLKYLRQQSKSGTTGTGTVVHLNPETIHQEEQFKQMVRKHNTPQGGTVEQQGPEVLQSQS